MPVISVRNIGKKYRLGATHSGRSYKTLRDVLTHAAFEPFRKLSAAFRKELSTSGNHSSPNNPITQLPANPQNSREFWALKDISFDVQQGEVLGIVGRNGAGKTTLLKILSQITEATEGEIRIRGRVASLLEVGTGFHPELTGRENIYMNGAILGMTRAEIKSKFDEIVAFAEVEKFIDTPVKRYSSGMYVRLAFAVAAHLEPEILLVDEVLAVGDVAFQKKCLGKMKDVSTQGRTVLFVSHNMGAVRSLCSRAMLIGNGKIMEEGVPDQVISLYLTSYTPQDSAFISLPPGHKDAPGSAKSLCFFSKDGSPKTQFRLYEPWLIRLEFELFHPVPHVIAAVGLVSFESVPIITYWSKARDLEAGLYYVQFECNVPLKRCDLQFAVGLSSHEVSFYFVNGIGHVSISEVAVGKQPFRASGSGILLSVQQSEIKPVEAMSDYSTDPQCEGK